MASFAVERAFSMVAALHRSNLVGKAAINSRRIQSWEVRRRGTRAATEDGPAVKARLSFRSLNDVHPPEQGRFQEIAGTAKPSEQRLRRMSSAVGKTPPGLNSATRKIAPAASALLTPPAASSADFAPSHARPLRVMGKRKKPKRFFDEN
jgi:hypothetical protein